MKKNHFNRNFEVVQGHQGDVQFFSVSNLPPSYKKVSKNFLAKSEKTGHVHALCGDYELYVNPEDENQFVVVVGDDGAVLNHTHFDQTRFEGFFDKAVALQAADHKPTFFKKGIYKIGIQRRLNPFTGFFESVQD